MMVRFYLLATIIEGDRKYEFYAPSTQFADDVRKVICYKLVDGVYTIFDQDVDLSKFKNRDQTNDYGKKTSHPEYILPMLRELN